MKVIKPLELLTSNRLLYTNAIDTVAAWNSATAYQQSLYNKKTIVYHNGAFWEALMGSTNQEPNTSSIYWTSLGSYIGELPAAQAVLSWSSATTYQEGQTVLYQNYYYSCLQYHTNQVPGTPGSTYWTLVGPVNSLAQFDQQVSTITYGNRLLTSTLSTPKINSIGIINPSGRRITVVCKESAADSGTWQIFNNYDVSDSSYDNTITQKLNTICYSEADNLLVAGGESGKIIYTQDAGETWLEAVTPNSTGIINSICYSVEVNRFIAVGSSSDTLTPVIWYSLDGINWTAASLTGVQQLGDQRLTTCIYVSGNINKFFAAGWRSPDQGAPVYSSSDGITWSDVSGASPPFGKAYALGYDAKNNNIVLGGSYRALNNTQSVYPTYYSSNGTTWATGATGFGTKDIKSLVWIPNAERFIAATGTDTFLIVGYIVGAPTYYTATVSFTLTGYAYNFNSVTYVEDSTNNPTFIAVADTGKIVKFKINNITSAPTVTNIQEITPIQNTDNLNQIYYNLAHDSLYIVGNAGKRIRSNITYHNSQILNIAYIGDWYDYFFADYSQKTEIILSGIPNYTNTRTTITIVSDPIGKTYSNKAISTSVSAIGNEIILGTTQWGASAGIIDYSRKETDEFGTTTFVQRAYSKRMNVNLILPSSDLTRVQKALIDLRATPCVWIGTTSNIYDVLVIYGFYRDFSLEIPYPEYSFCSLQIEGLT